IGNANTVLALAVQSDGKILVGSYARTNFSRLNPDGSLDATFECRLQASPPYSSYASVGSIIVQSNGQVLIGGYGLSVDGFVTVDGVVRPDIARIFGNIPQPTLTGAHVLTSQFGFNVAGYSNQIVIIESSTNLLNWLPLQTNTLGSIPLPFN